MSTTKNKPKVLIAGYIGMFFFGVAFIVMGAVLPSISAKFALSEVDSAALVGLLPIGIMIASLVFGPVIDRYGYKSLMIIATLIGALGLMMLAFVQEVSLIRLSVFFIGLGGGALNGATNALVADASDDHSKASNLSLLGFFYCVGAFSIPFLLASLSEYFDYTRIVAATGIIFFLTALYYLLITFPPAKQKQGIPFKKIVGMAREPILLLFSFVLFFQSGMEALAQNWSPTYFTTITGLTLEQAQYALSFIVVGMGISRLLMSFLADRLNDRLIISGSMLLSAFGVICLFFVTNTIGAILSTTLIGLGFASTFPLVLARISERYKELSGTAFSFALVIGLIGNTLLNLLIGFIGIDRLGWLLLVSVCMVALLYNVGKSVITSKSHKL